MDVFTREKGWQPGAEEGEEDQMAYGCLFCMTGREEQVAARIRDGYPAYRAVSLRKMRYRTSHGQRTSEVVQLLPSYVFRQAPAEANPFRELPKNDVIRILTTGDGEWRLRDGDRRFAQWVFRYDGLLDFSKAYREGERIRIISGPLKDMEGKILRVDKRGRSGQVTLEFNGRTIPIWLGFELIDLV